MPIVSVVNQKGGVGKTTTTANLGVCLAKRGQTTLLIDLDPQANLTLGLGGDASILHHSLSQVLLDPVNIPLASIIQHIGDIPLYLAPGHLDIARAEAHLTIAAGEAIYSLDKALRRLAARYPVDWVLIDCPPSLGLLTQNAIVASDYLLVPTEPSMYAFAGMDTLNKMIEGLARQHTVNIRLLGVLLTLYQRGTRLHRTIAGVIRERFGDEVFATEIYRSMQISAAEIEARPISLLDPRAPGAKNYAALADEVIRRAQSHQEEHLKAA